MIFDEQARPESRPDKKLLSRLASRRRPSSAAPPETKISSKRKALATSSPKVAKAASGWATKVQTCPGMGKQMVAKASEVFVNPWDERRPTPALAALAHKATRSVASVASVARSVASVASVARSVKGTRAPSLGAKRSQDFSSAELDFFTEGEGLAERASLAKAQAEAEAEVEAKAEARENTPRWWQRLPKPTRKGR